MSKFEIIKDYLDTEQQCIIMELSVPLDFLREAVSHPDKIQQAFALGFSEAMNEFIIKKQVLKDDVQTK